MAEDSVNLAVTVGVLIVKDGEAGLRTADGDFIFAAQMNHPIMFVYPVAETSASDADRETALRALLGDINTLGAGTCGNCC